MPRQKKHNPDPTLLKILDIIHSFVAHDVVAISGVTLATLPLEDWYRQQGQPASGDVVAGIRTVLLVVLGARGVTPAIPAIARLAEAGASQGAPGLFQQIMQGVPYP